MTPAHVVGLGSWSLGSDPTAASEPGCRLLTAALRRRASLLTQMLVEVVAQAGYAAAVDLGSVPTVFGTAYGEIQTLHDLLEMLQAGDELSPARFHNSVYNAASGYFSIAAGNRSFTTTVAAGADTVAMALLEAFCILQERREPVIVAFADEASTLPFLQKEGAGSLAAAICITPECPAERCLGRLSPPRRGPVPVLPAIDPAFLSNPIAPALPLVRALQSGETGVVPVCREVGEGWLVELFSA
jgi:hypothetical protein